MHNIIEKIRSNFSLKIIALVVAMVIWLLVTNSNDPTRSILIANVPINIVNEDSVTDIGKVVEPQGSGTVTLRVTERNSVLRRLSRTGSDFYVEADLENLNDMYTVPLTVTCSNPAVTWDEISIQPSSLKVSVEDKAEQAFAVSVVPSGNTADGYAVGSTQVMDGTNILIAGPKSLIGIINQVYAPVSVSGMREDGILTSTLRVVDKNGADFTEAQLSRLEFKDSAGNVLSDRQVLVSVELWKVVPEIAVRVQTTGSTKIGYRVAQITTIPQTITLVGTEEAFEELGNVLIVDEKVDVTNLSEDFTLEIDLTQTIAGYEELRLPVDADPVISVQVQFEKSGDRRIEVPMGEITLKNRPDKMKLVFTPADVLPVIVHSVDEEGAPLELLEAEDVKVTIDLSSCVEEGNYELPASVQLPEGYELSADVKVAVSAMENTEPAEQEGNQTILSASS